MITLAPFLDDGPRFTFSGRSFVDDLMFTITFSGTLDSLGPPAAAVADMIDAGVNVADSMLRFGALLPSGMAKRSSFLLNDSVSRSSLSRLGGTLVGDTVADGAMTVASIVFGHVSNVVDVTLVASLLLPLLQSFLWSRRPASLCAASFDDERSRERSFGLVMDLWLILLLLPLLQLLSALLLECNLLDFDGDFSCAEAGVDELRLVLFAVLLRDDDDDDKLSSRRAFVGDDDFRCFDEDSLDEDLLLW